MVLFTKIRVGRVGRPWGHGGVGVTVWVGWCAKIHPGENGLTRCGHRSHRRDQKKKIDGVGASYAVGEWGWHLCVVNLRIKTRCQKYTASSNQVTPRFTRLNLSYGEHINSKSSTEALSCVRCLISTTNHSCLLFI